MTATPTRPTVFDATVVRRTLNGAPGADVHLRVDPVTAEFLDDALDTCRRAGLIPRKRPSGYRYLRTTDSNSGAVLLILDPVTAEHLGHAWCRYHTGPDAQLPEDTDVISQTVALLTAAGQAAHDSGVLEPRPAIGTLAGLTVLRRV